jgi:hypothetical protein
VNVGSAVEVTLGTMVGVRSMVAVALGSMVGGRVAVAVALGTTVAVRSVVAVALGAMVGVRVAVAVALGNAVGVRTAVAVAVAAIVSVRLATAVAVAVIVEVRRAVAVAVGTMVRLEMTVRASGAETAAGPGFATAMRTEPACAALPVAVSPDEELRVVGSAAPFHRTCAPATNWLPVTCRVNGPSDSGFGLRLVSDGTGLCTVITQLADAAGFATLVAFAVTVHPTGGDAGAVYLPVASMAPTTALPPTIPLTDQMTAVLIVPFTYAVRRRSPPMGTLADGGEIVTVWARAGAALASIDSRMPSAKDLWSYARMCILPIGTGDSRMMYRLTDVTASGVGSRKHVAFRG